MKKMAIILGLGASLILGPLNVQADTVFGVYASVGKWRIDASGDIGVTGTDLNDLGFNERDNNLFHIALEHPVPLLPNIMLKHTDLSIDGQAVLSEPVEFDNIVFPPGASLATQLDLSHIDATLYYEVLDNWLNLDFGLTIRSYRGELTAVSAAQTETVDLDAVLPMAYLKGQIDLPLTGFAIKADANAIAYSGDGISDVSAALAWSTDVLVAFDIGIELGYRRAEIDLDDLGDLDTMLTFDGPYLAINAHF